MTMCFYNAKNLENNGTKEIGFRLKTVLYHLLLTKFIPIIIVILGFAELDNSH